MKDNKLGSDGAITISEALQTNTTLTSLSLFSNGMDKNKKAETVEE